MYQGWTGGDRIHIRWAIVHGRSASGKSQSAIAGLAMP